MTPDRMCTSIVLPTLKLMADMPDVGIPVSDTAVVELVAIAGQESGWSARRQIGIGQYYPQTVGARSYWQMESTWGGPVAINDVMQRVPNKLAAVCAYLEIPTDELGLYEACAWNDTLACALARLLLWIDPSPLPALGQKDVAWNYYVRNWHPGAPHYESWYGNYDAAMQALRAA